MMQHTPKSLQLDLTTRVLAELDKWMLSHSYRCVDLFRSQALNESDGSALDDDTIDVGELRLPLTTWFPAGRNTFPAAHATIVSQPCT